MSDYLAHVGTPHEGATPHSGRYAWGSGENPSQRPHTFLENVDKYVSFSPDMLKIEE